MANMRLSASSCGCCLGGLIAFKYACTAEHSVSGGGRGVRRLRRDEEDEEEDLRFLSGRDSSVDLEDRL